MRRLVHHVPAVDQARQNAPRNRRSGPFAGGGLVEVVGQPRGSAKFQASGCPLVAMPCSRHHRATFRSACVLGLAALRLRTTASRTAAWRSSAARQNAGDRPPPSSASAHACPTRRCSSRTGTRAASARRVTFAPGTGLPAASTTAIVASALRCFSICASAPGQQLVVGRLGRGAARPPSGSVARASERRTAGERRFGYIVDTSVGSEGVVGASFATNCR